MNQKAKVELVNIGTKKSRTFEAKWNGKSLNFFVVNYEEWGLLERMPGKTIDIWICQKLSDNTYAALL